MRRLSIQIRAYSRIDSCLTMRNATCRIVNMYLGIILQKQRRKVGCLREELCHSFRLSCINLIIIGKTVLVQ